jgi:hypothetical protein
MLPLVNKAAGPWWEVHAVSTADNSKAMLFFRVEVSARSVCMVPSRPCLCRCGDQSPPPPASQHACADGVALTQVLSKLCTSLDGSPLPAAAYSKQPKPKADFCALLCAALKS